MTDTHKYLMLTLETARTAFERETPMLDGVTRQSMLRATERIEQAQLIMATLQIAPDDAKHGDDNGE